MPKDENLKVNLTDDQLAAIKKALGVSDQKHIVIRIEVASKNSTHIMALGAENSSMMVTLGWCGNGVWC